MRRLISALTTILFVCASQSMSAGESPQARIPYNFLRKLVESQQVGVYKVTYVLEDPQGKGLPPLAAYIDSKDGRLPLVLRNGVFVGFPLNAKLAKENPFVVLNRPKGTVLSQYEVNWNFNADYAHPHRCSYRDVMVASVFVANLYRVAENKDELSVEEYPDWASPLRLEAKEGVKCLIQVETTPRQFIPLSGTPLGCYFEPAAWRENPPVLLAFKKEDVKLGLGAYPPECYFKYSAVRTWLQTTRSGVVGLEPQLVILKELPDRPPLEIYITARSGRIPLQLRNRTLQNFSLSEDLSREDPLVVINRPRACIQLGSAVTFHCDSTPFRCRYRDLLGVLLCRHNLDRKLCGFPDQSLEDLETQPSLNLGPAKQEFSIQILGRSKTLEIHFKPGEMHSIPLDKALWQENPEIVVTSPLGNLKSVPIKSSGIRSSAHAYAGKV